MWCCLVGQLCAQCEVLGDVLEVVGDAHPRAGEEVGVAQGEGGGVVVPLVVRGQLQCLPLGLLYLRHHLTPGQHTVINFDTIITIMFYRVLSVGACMMWDWRLPDGSMSPKMTG